MAAGRFCDQCSVDLYETDPNERISLVPQVILGLWPLLLDTQDQLDFCKLDHLVSWFQAAKKARPARLKAEAKRDAKVTTEALDAADRSAEIMARLIELPDQQARFEADPSSKQAARALEQERHRLLRELHEIGGGRALSASPPSGVTAGSKGPRGRSGKVPNRR